MPRPSSATSQLPSACSTTSMLRVAGQRLVHRVVDHFLREVVGARGVGVLHARATPDRVKPGQDFDVGGVVACGHARRCVFMVEGRDCRASHGEVKARCSFAGMDGAATVDPGRRGPAAMAARLQQLFLFRFREIPMNHRTRFSPCSSPARSPRPPAAFARTRPAPASRRPWRPPSRPTPPPSNRLPPTPVPPPATRA